MVLTDFEWVNQQGKGVEVPRRQPAPPNLLPLRRPDRRVSWVGGGSSHAIDPIAGVAMKVRHS